jgi:hypothetical protein
MTTMQDLKQMDKLTCSVDRQQGSEGQGCFRQITVEKRIWKKIFFKPEPYWAI